MQITSFALLAQFHNLLQTELFPTIESLVDTLSKPARLLVSVVSMTPLQRWVGDRPCSTGRIPADRVCIATAFLAKAIYNMTTTRQVLVRLQTDTQLRRLCGWDNAGQVPSEATFSRAFAEFASSKVFERMHAELVRNSLQGQEFDYLSRDSTAIESRQLLTGEKPKPEAPVETSAAPQKNKTEKKKQKKKTGPKGPHKRAKACERGKRLERQRYMNLKQMIEDLPTACDWGAKRNSQGNDEYWGGYKVHWDVVCSGRFRRIPVSCLITSASVQDSQVALPLMTISAERVRWKCDLMDSAYDAKIIRQQCAKRGHEAIIKPIKRKRNKPIPGADELTAEEKERFKRRTVVEQMNARLKDEFGGRIIYVRGAAKVMAHLMFGIVALTVDQLLLQRTG